MLDSESPTLYYVESSFLAINRYAIRPIPRALQNVTTHQARKKNHQNVNTEQDAIKEGKRQQKHLMSTEIDFSFWK